MPVYESNLPHEEMQKAIDKGCVCLECGALLTIAWGGFYGHNEYMLRCGNDPKHEGVARDASLSPYEIPGFNLFNLNKGRKKRMVQEHGAAKTKALDKYMGGGLITKEIATEIVDTLWGEAPTVEKEKAIIICQTYQLNPLMKHLYLVGYKRYKDRKLVVDAGGKPVLDWSIQIGIGATRLMAQRKHKFSYLDMSPRKATPTEIEKAIGEKPDPGKVYGFCWLRDVVTGAEAFGFRVMSKTDSIKGELKGNTHQNQVNIRAERQGLDRLCPGEMPANVEVFDERYAEDTKPIITSEPDVIEGEARVLNTTTGEILESETANELGAEPEKEHWCEEHGCQYDKKVRGRATWYAHKIEGTDDWCNEKDKVKAPKEPTSQPEPEPRAEPSKKPEPDKQRRDPSTISTINDLYKACHADFKNAEGKGMQPEDVIKELGVSSQSDISDTPADCYSKIAAVR